MLTTWDTAARSLGVEVRSRREHERRWSASLTPRSTYVRLREQSDVEPGVLLDAALDASVGVALAADRLQRACFGPTWTARRSHFKRGIQGLDLPLQPPPGFDAGQWLAIRAVMMDGAETWDEAGSRLPEETELLQRLFEHDPDEYERLADAALSIGGRIDVNTRRDVVLMKDELNDAEAFRKEWAAAFGAMRTRPAAPTHLAVSILNELLADDARSIGLFLRHVGLSQAAVVGFDEDSEAASVRRLDDEVYNARQALRRFREGEASSSPRRLCDTIEWVTSEELRRLAPRTSPA